MSVSMLDAPETSRRKRALCCAFGDVLGGRVGVEAHGGGGGGEGAHEALEDCGHVGGVLCGEEDAEEEDEGCEEGEQARQFEGRGCGLQVGIEKRVR